MNTHPLHFDLNYASQTEFEKPLMNSTLTLALVSGMSVSDTSQRAIANLGWDKVRLLAPVFEGDTLYAESEVLAKRLSKSRPGQGIVAIKTRGINQHDVPVISFERSFLIALRDPSSGDLG
jgi:itaconyl-CoA hydratase